HPAKCLGELAVLDRRMRGQSPDADGLRRRTRLLELVEAADVDQEVGERDAQGEHRQQGLAARNCHGMCAVRAQRGASVRNGRWLHIIELRWLHRVAPLARRARSTASDTRRGVNGVSSKLAPMSRNASATALAMAAGGAMAPPSPNPFTPYSVVSAGVTR